MRAALCARLSTDSDKADLKGLNGEAVKGQNP